MQAEALNHALAGIPAEQVRFHICWGNGEGPHTSDIPLDILRRRAQSERAGVLGRGIESPARARVEALERLKLPEGKVLIPGVLDSTTNFVEHPELVAERIVHTRASWAGRTYRRDGLRLRDIRRPVQDRPRRRVQGARVSAQGAEIASKGLWS